MPLNTTDLNTRIDALLRADDFGLDAWYTAESTVPLVMTYRFETTKAADWPWSNVADPVAFTASYETVIRTALDMFEAVLNITFVEDNSAVDAGLSFYRSTDIFTDSDVPVDGRAWNWFSYYTTDGVTVYEWDGHVALSDYVDLAAPDRMYLLVHEIGHALGLKHPGNYDAIVGNEPPGPFFPAGEDNNKYSTMSYITNPDTLLNSDGLMLYDIAALQKWWGASVTTNSGNTVHKALESTALKVIYDADGTDWLRYGGEGAARIDLRQGSFSALDGLDVAAIAYGTEIENAAGGAGRDWLIGNSGRNVLLGGAGRDHLKGGFGSDTLKGGKGGDWLVAGKGADKLTGGGGADKFVFNGALKEGRNIITDFMDGVDMIRIKGLEFADVDIAASGFSDGNTKLTLSSGTQIVLKGVDADLISEDDFQFI